MRHEARNPKQVERTFTEYLIGYVNVVALHVAGCWNCSHLSPTRLCLNGGEYHASILGSVAYFTVHQDADGMHVLVALGRHAVSAFGCKAAAPLVRSRGSS